MEGGARGGDERWREGEERWREELGEERCVDERWRGEMGR
jgi:hypothetical protein